MESLSAVTFLGRVLSNLTAAMTAPSLFHRGSSVLLVEGVRSGSSSVLHVLGFWMRQGEFRFVPNILVS